MGAPGWLNGTDMGTRTPTVVIVGASLAGGAAASTLRQEGFDGPIVLIGQEPHPPYERPPLSKEYLRGQSSFAGALLRPRSWYQESEVDLLTEAWVDRVDVAARTVRLEGGRSIGYDRLLITTGGRNRRLEVPGSHLDGIHDLRTVEDADAIRADASPGSTAVVVGAGLIGSEVAASLRSLGVGVEVVEIFDVPLQRAIGPDVGAVFERIHRDHGVRYRFGQTVSAFEGHGRVESVLTDRGARIDCDFAVVAIGIEPETRLVAGTDVAVDNGILVDEHTRTNVPGVYAAGDVANHVHPLFGRRLRVEHFDNAIKQGAAAARNILGRDAVFDDPHWFWSDQYEHNLQFLGHAPAWDEFVVRGKLEDRRFVGFYMRDGLVDGVVGLDRGRDVRRAAGLIRARMPVDLELLRDEDVDLKQLGAKLMTESEG